VGWTIPLVDGGEGPTATSDDAADSRLLSSVGKALAILDVFEGGASILGVSEIARQAHLAKSTAFRLLASLEQQGYIERRADRYCLGKRLFELGNQVSWCRPRSLRETALPYMCDLFSTIRKTIHLAVLVDGDVLYVEKLQGHDQVRAPTRVGGKVSASTTALGKAILAFSAPAVVEDALKKSPSLRTPHTILLPSLLLEELETVRREGVAYDREEVMIGLTCVAAPIMSLGEPVGALSVSGNTEKFDPTSVAQRVRATANTIGSQLTSR
jgi:DNA-binding IclR family transcriptional regulator